MNYTRNFVSFCNGNNVATGRTTLFFHSSDATRKEIVEQNFIEILIRRNKEFDFLNLSLHKKIPSFCTVLQWKTKLASKNRSAHKLFNPQLLFPRPYPFTKRRKNLYIFCYFHTVITITLERYQSFLLH